MQWGRRAGLLAVVCCLGCGHTPSLEGDLDEESDTPVCDPTSAFDVSYATTSAAPHLTTLDVLVGKPDPGQPIVIWVHGGGWVGGDKASHEINPAFAEHFADRGEILVPVNYRLVDDPDSPGTTFGEQAADVAAAVDWVLDHAESKCGDPARVHLVGYSAGAHLVALVAADPSYLGAYGHDPSVLSSVVSLDVNAYDIPWAIENAEAHDYPAAIVNLPAVFGSPASQAQASPINFIEPGAVPPSLVISAPDQNGVMQTLSKAVSGRYMEALTDADNEALYFDAENDSHSSLALDFGVPGDEVTEVVDAFLDTH